MDSKCSCKIGFYSCGTKCKECIEPCTVCTSETNCLDCGSGDNGKFFYMGTCRRCEYPCENCSSLTRCLTCGYEPEKRVNSSTCPCKVGYYELGYVCMLCEYPCIRCTS